MKIFLTTLFVSHFFSLALFAGEVLVGQSTSVKGRDLSARGLYPPHEPITMTNRGNQLSFVPLIEINDHVKVRVFRGTFAIGDYFISYDEYEKHRLGELAQAAMNGLHGASQMNDVNCPQSDLLSEENHIDSKALQGARRVLATMFQSCGSLNEAIGADTPHPEGLRTRDPTDAERDAISGLSRVRVVDDVEALANSHIFLKEHSEGREMNSSCQDVRGTPPIYAYGGEPSYNTQTREVDLFVSNRGVDPDSRNKSISIDCSAFIAAALASSGLKIAKNEEGYFRHTTVSIHNAGQEADSCVPPAQVSPLDILKPGDIFNQQSAHVIMIDEVGEDPLAIDRFSGSQEECLNITVEDFNFTYVHSGALNGSYGPSRVHSSAHANTPGAMFTQLQSLAVSMCQRKANGDSASVNSTELFSSDAFSLLRHDSDNEDCTFEPTPLKNQKCLDDCPSVYRNTGFSK